jgi:iron(III) transport system permease protein
VLLGIAILSCALAVTPLVYIFIRAAGASPEVWGRLWAGRIPGLLANTVALVVVTGAFTTLLGLGLAWLVERTDLPGRNVFRWALAMPLAIPAYVGALSYLIVLRRGGLLEQAFMSWGGWELGRLPLPSLYTLWGAAAIMSLFIFPYVYLPVSAALRSTDWTLEEAARVGGHSAWGTFRRVVLPMLLPSLLVGMLLVCLYALSDFGTVALLQFRTFTVAIYNQFAGQIDRSGAAILSFVLVALALPLLLGEAWSHRRNRLYAHQATWKPRRLVALGRWRIVALIAVLLVIALSLGLPIVVLGGLTLQGWLQPTYVDRIWGVGLENIWQHALNSLLVSGLAATLAMALAFAPSYLAARYPGKVAGVLLLVGKASYALPGLIIGLSLIMLFSQAIPALYGTVFVLVLAFSIRFLPQALATTEAAMKATSAQLEMAARTMGRKPWQVFRTITLPLAAPGLAAGWALVFLTAMKELPTAILLRPPGFDTLPVRIWAASNESVYTQAAPPAFLLIAVTMVAMSLVFTKGKFGTDEVVL